MLGQLMLGEINVAVQAWNYHLRSHVDNDFLNMISLVEIHAIVAHM